MIFEPEDRSRGSAQVEKILKGNSTKIYCVKHTPYTRLASICSFHSFDNTVHMYNDRVLIKCRHTRENRIVIFNQLSFTQLWFYISLDHIVNVISCSTLHLFRYYIFCMNVIPCFQRCLR